MNPQDRIHASIALIDFRTLRSRFIHPPASAPFSGSLRQMNIYSIINGFPREQRQRFISALRRGTSTEFCLERENGSLSVGLYSTCSFGECWSHILTLHAEDREAALSQDCSAEKYRFMLCHAFDIIQTCSHFAADNLSGKDSPAAMDYLDRAGSICRMLNELAEDTDYLLHTL